MGETACSHYSTSFTSKNKDSKRVFLQRCHRISVFGSKKKLLRKQLFKEPFLFKESLWVLSTYLYSNLFFALCQISHCATQKKAPKSFYVNQMAPSSLIRNTFSICLLLCVCVWQHLLPLQRVVTGTTGAFLYTHLRYAFCSLRKIG